MALTRAELEHLSIYYHIKDSILARKFSQEVQNDPLSLDTKLYQGLPASGYTIVDPNYGAYGTFPTDKGRGWLYFDYSVNAPAEVLTSSGVVSTFGTPFFNHSFSIPQKFEQNTVVVRDQFGSIMDRSWYQVDYRAGRIRYPAPTTPSGVVSSGIFPTTVDYKFHLVSLVDGWPDYDKIPELPIVALYPIGDTIKGLQLGGGVEYSREYAISVFATSSSERRALLDSIRNGLYQKHTPVIDFNRTGEPLKHWGVVNPSFFTTLNHVGVDYTTYLTLNAGNGNILYFLDIEVEYDASPTSAQAEVMKHMGMVTFRTCTISDKDPELVGKFSSLEQPLGGFDSLILSGYSE